MILKIAVMRKNFEKIELLLFALQKPYLQKLLKYCTSKFRKKDQVYHWETLAKKIHALIRHDENDNNNANKNQRWI